MTFLLVALVLFFYYSNHSYQVSNYKISNDVPKGFDGFKIAHLSDLHDHKLKASFYLKLNHLDPDIVVLTGDIIDSRRFNLDRCKSNLEKIPYPMYFVTGNHEIGSKRLQEIVEMLQSIGVTFLENESISLKRNKDLIDLYGNTIKTYPELQKKRYTILLSHRSELIYYYRASKADLILTGHAHGGQIRLLSKGLYAPNQGWWPQFTSGQHDFGKSVQIINRGIGNSTFKQRLFNRPEIGFIVLERKSHE